MNAAATSPVTSTWRTPLVPSLLSVAFGDLLAGMPINGSDMFTGTFWGLLTPYGLWLGLTMTVLCALHGATFLGLRTTWPLCGRSQVLARRIAWPALLLVVVFAVWTVLLSGGGPWRLAGHERRAFATTAVTIGGTIAALFANLYPDAMVSSSSQASTLTVEGTASGDYALKVMTVIAVVVLPVVLLYQGWSYWVFRGRLGSGSQWRPRPGLPVRSSADVRCTGSRRARCRCQPSEVAGRRGGIAGSSWGRTGANPL